MKRGEVDSFGVIISFIVGGIILGVVIFSLVFFQDDIKNWANTIPSYGNESKPVVLDTEIVKYSLVDEKMYYYDGNSWIAFPDEKQGGNPIDCKIVLNEKIYTCSLKNNFYGYYYAVSNIPGYVGDRKDVPAANGLPAVTYRPGSTTDLDGINIYSINPWSTLNGGDILLHGFVRFKWGDWDYFLNYDNQVYVAKFGSQDYVPKEWNPAFDQVKKWRDSIFENPIDLYYIPYGEDNSQQVHQKYCIEKQKNSDFIIRLQNPTTSSVCS